MLESSSRGFWVGEQNHQTFLYSELASDQEGLNQAKGSVV